MWGSEIKMDKEKFEAIAKKFETRKDKKGNILNMRYLLIHQDGDTFETNFSEWNEISDIRSISKTVLTLVAGIIMDLSRKGQYPDFTEESYIYPIIKQSVNLEGLKNNTLFKKVKVKHLITHTTGYDTVLMMRNDIAHINPFNYLEYLMNETIKYEPGEYYLYSNAGFYLLSVVLQEFVKEDLLTFVNRHLFSKLNIHNYEWQKYGDYLAGATRLKMLPQDLLKIGQVFMNHGFYNHVRIISENWINKMLVPRFYTSEVDTPNALFRRYAYGYGIWLGKENIYFGHGTDGQTMIMVPNKNYIIITMADQNDKTEIEHILNDIITNYL